MSAKGLIIAAPRSGAGKTSVTIGLLRALKRRGIGVRGAKSGPDYIDPAFHTAACGQQGVNLDSWSMRPNLLDALILDAASSVEFLFIESSMGLFDGIDGEEGRSGAAADLARRYGLPVLLVLDVTGQSRSAAAIAHGFNSFDPDISLAGVVLNQVASDRHHDQVATAVERSGIKVLGSIRRNSDMAMPERHLGLVQAGEYEALDKFIDRMADVMETQIDIDAVLACSKEITTSAAIRAAKKDTGETTVALPPPGQRIAIAKDTAFTFIYPHLLRQWREAGAELFTFSPLANEAPPDNCDVCWLPGGYPELHAGKLATAETFQDGMIKFSRTRAVHGECGGFMVLGEALTDADGTDHKMLGLLGHSTSFAKRKMNLGYRRATLLADCPIGPAGTRLRGHEFHYASVTPSQSDEPLVQLSDGVGNEIGARGAWRGLVSGTFFHAIALED